MKTMLRSLLGLVTLFTVTAAVFAGDGSFGCRSIAESKKSGFFIQEFDVEPTVLPVGKDGNVTIKEAWLEHGNVTKPFLLFFSKKHPTPAKYFLRIRIAENWKGKPFYPFDYQLDNETILSPRISFFSHTYYTRIGLKIVSCMPKHQQDTYTIKYLDNGTRSYIGVITLKRK